MAPPTKKARFTQSTKDFISGTTSVIDSDISTKPGYLSLEAFVFNAFYDVFVQDQDEIAELTYNRIWSRHLEELENGHPLNFTTFHDFLFTTRQAISNRILISQSAIVSSSDPSGLTGQVAHTQRLSGVQNGKKIYITVVPVLKVRLEKKERKIETTSFILESSFQPIPKEIIMTIKAQVSNAFHGIFIQDQEAIFEIAFQSWSKHLVQNVNGKALDFKTFRDLVRQIRAEISDRLLLSEEILVGEIDDDGTTLQVAHKPTFRGVRNRDGKLVEVSIVAVATSAPDREGKEDSGPKVQRETLVLVVNEVE